MEFLGGFRVAFRGFRAGGPKGRAAFISTAIAGLILACIGLWVRIANISSNIAVLDFGLQAALTVGLVLVVVPVVIHLLQRNDVSK